MRVHYVCGNTEQAPQVTRDASALSLRPPQRICVIQLFQVRWQAALSQTCVRVSLSSFAVIDVLIYQHLQHLGELWCSIGNTYRRVERCDDEGDGVVFAARLM